ncbi:hypothetical protein HYY72_04240 [Candidatus Woesearchaeota archaeon]|nr:hypothetical protein [Candidatus Woesearchaeota archaeon]
MIMLSKNRVLDALLKFVVISAAVHLIVLAAYSLKTGQFTWLNYFKMIGIDLFFPNVLESPQATFLSMTTVAALYILIFFLFTKKAG